MRRLLTFVLFCQPGLLLAQSKTLTVDYNTNVGVIKKLTGVNVGPNTVSSAGTAKLCYQGIGVEMVRTHDYHGPCDYWGYTTFFDYFLQTFNYSFKSYQTSGYNWTNTDNQINQITSAGLTPFFRLGISFPGTGPSPATPMPKDIDGVNFSTFAGICKRTAMHYTAGWNNGFNYTIPYWEVWNEPNNGASWAVDSVSAYYRMYKQVTDSLKGFNPALKVGGPALARSAFYTNNSPGFVLKQEYLSNFFQFCNTNSAPLDFYSFHTYDRNNPYHVKLLADTISHYLNQYGFTNTELVISEMNNHNSSYQNSSKGCAYLTSTLISALDSRITKICWYRGVDLGPLCNADSASLPQPTVNGYAYQFFNSVCDTTPIRITAVGNEIVTNNINDTTSNLMLVAGKESSGETVKVLVSNLASNYSEFNIAINNLSWTASNLIKTRVESITNLGYSTYTTFSSGFSTMTVNIPSVTPQSIYLVTLEKQAPAAVFSLNGLNNDVHIYPNPSSDIINIEIKNTKSFTVRLYDLMGRKILEKDNTTTTMQLNVSDIAKGIYYIEVKTSQGLTTQKISISK